LNSVSWEKLGNGLCAGRVPPKIFHALLRQGPSSFYHIQVDKILVVDHLGRNIPVPTMFCGTWKEFDYIIHGYCKDSVGSHFIKRGDYRLICAEDSQTIGPSEFASSVESGMVLEMSIVLRETGFKDSKEKCPRCGHINLVNTANYGWIECQKCSGQFQTVTANSEIGTEKCKLSPLGARNEERGDRHRDEDIVPPTLQNSRIDSMSKADDGPQDNDVKLFFRRIHVIYTNRDTLDMSYSRPSLGAAATFPFCTKDTLIDRPILRAWLICATISPLCR